MTVSLEEGRLEHLQDESPVLQVEWVQDAILFARFTELTGEVSSCHTYVLEMVKGVDPGTIQDQLEQVFAESVELHLIVKEVNTMGQEHVGSVIVDQDIHGVALDNSDLQQQVLLELSTLLLQLLQVVDGQVGDNPSEDLQPSGLAQSREEVEVLDVVDLGSEIGVMKIPQHYLGPHVENGQVHVGNCELGEDVSSRNS